MKYEKPILKREVIKVFENECNLDNYELVALVDAFEDLRLLREESDPATLRTGHAMLYGTVNFLTAAQHITEAQCGALLLIADKIIG